MATTKREEKIEKLQSFLKKKGWKKDAYGHYKKGSYRMKFGTNSVRYETKVASSWVRLRSGYYKNIDIDENEKIAGLKR